MSPNGKSDLDGPVRPARVFLVTGATGAIGQAIARQLAARPGHEVVVVARDERKAQRTVAAIRDATGNPAVRYELAELSLRREIRALRERWQGPLHGLVNNAAECPRRREETEEGIERQLATNVLAYVRLIRAFEDVLGASAPARVVNVASYWAGGLDLSDLEFRRRRYDNDDAYRQSKQADRMLSAAFADRLRERGVTVNAVHPGDVRSKLSGDLGFGGHETPDQGAATPVLVATDPSFATVTGRYVAHGQVEEDAFTRDRAAVEALFAACTAYDP